MDLDDLFAWFCSDLNENRNTSVIRLIATSKACEASTFTSGSIPVPSELMWVTELMARAEGHTAAEMLRDPMAAHGMRATCGVFPRIVARFRTFRLLVNSSPPDKAFLDVASAHRPQD